MAMLEKSIDRSWDTKLSHPSSVRLRDFHAPFPSKPSGTSSIASKKSALELIARGFGPGTSGYPGFRFPHLKKYRISDFLVPETTLHCPQRSFFLVCLANRYLLPQNNI